VDGDAVYLRRAVLDVPSECAQSLVNTLVTDKRARAETFRFESNRTRFIVAHEMLRAIIAKPSLPSGPARIRP